VCPLQIGTTSVPDGPNDGEWVVDVSSKHASRQVPKSIFDCHATGHQPAITMCGKRSCKGTIRQPCQLGFSTILVGYAQAPYGKDGIYFVVLVVVSLSVGYVQQVYIECGRFI
jgi:hypothetical protein